MISKKVAGAVTVHPLVVVDDDGFITIHSSVINCDCCGDTVVVVGGGKTVIVICIDIYVPELHDAGNFSWIFYRLSMDLVRHIGTPVANCNAVKLKLNSFPLYNKLLIN
jgi:hypothetical protein